MADGQPDGLIIATRFGWTGQITVARQTTFDRLLGREDLDRPGIYILSGPDPADPSRTRAYIGEADNILDRLPASANDRGEWWETVAAITTSDSALNKGHVRYLEARLIEIARASDRVSLANSQQPPAARRYLSEADQANMESFIQTLAAILPLVGFDLLKPQPRVHTGAAIIPAGEPQHPSAFFTINHKSGVSATAFESGEEFVVRANSQALRGSGNHNYARLKENLIQNGVLIPDAKPEFWRFTKDYPFSSPSAAAAVVLDRSSNGRVEWRLPNGETFADWQTRISRKPEENI